MINITGVSQAGSPRLVVVNFTTDLVKDLLSLSQVTADWGATAAYGQPAVVGQMTGMVGSLIGCTVAIATDLNPLYFNLQVSDYSNPANVDSLASQYPAATVGGTGGDGDGGRDRGGDDGGRRDGRGGGDGRGQGGHDVGHDGGHDGGRGKD